MKKIFLIASLSTLLYSSCTFEKSEALTVGCDATMSYATDIKPIIDAKCVSCHTTGASQGDFQTYAVVKSKIDNGTFKNRVFTVKDMPPGGSTPVTEEELGKIKCWMEQGSLDN